MTIYVDYVFFINFLFDFILLGTINIILKRNISYKRLLLSSILGGIFTFIIYLDVSSTIYFILKLSTGLILILISFKYKDIKYFITNFIYLIIFSVIYGGGLYLLNNDLGYSQDGIIYFSEAKVLNLLILLFLFILISVILIKIFKYKNININTNYEVILYFNNKTINLVGFLDTGNNLYDPCTNKPICILNKNIKINSNKLIFCPYKTLNSTGILKCFIIDKIYIKNIGFKEKVLIGISNDKFHLNGADIILNKDLWEE